MAAGSIADRARLAADLGATPEGAVRYSMSSSQETIASSLAVG
jgi:hypothetical protein